MSWFSNLVGGAAAEPIAAVGAAVDELFTSDEEKINAQTFRERVRQNPQKWLSMIALAQSQHRSVFVAGARPFCIWIAGCAVGYQYIVRDLLHWALLLYDKTIPIPPALGLSEMMAALGTILGLGVYRTVEKTRGHTR